MNGITFANLPLSLADRHPMEMGKINSLFFLSFIYLLLLSFSAILSSITAQIFFYLIFFRQIFFCLSIDYNISIRS